MTVGKIPSGYGKNIKTIKFTTGPKIFKYLKFKHSSYLGIGYLKILEFNSKVKNLNSKYILSNKSGLIYDAVIVKNKYKLKN